MKPIDFYGANGANGTYGANEKTGEQSRGNFIEDDADEANSSDFSVAPVVSLDSVVPVASLDSARGIAVVAGLEAGSGHLLADAALFEELILQLLYQAFEQYVCLVDECGGKVADHLGITFGKYRHVCLCIRAVETFLAKLYSAGIVFIPKTQPSHSEVVFIIKQKLLKRGFRHVQELYLCLSGSR